MYYIIYKYIYNIRPVTQKLHLFLARSDYGKPDIGNIDFKS